jgi:hypothetical protein
MKTEEQLLRLKFNYLEDRVKVLDKAVGRINQILGRFQMTEATGFEDIGDDNGNTAIITEERDHELI